MQRGWEVSGYHHVQDIGSSRGVVRVSGWGDRLKDKTGVTIGIITQEYPPPRAQPSIPADIFDVQFTGKSRPATRPQSKRPSPLRSVGGKAKGMPQGLSPVYRPA